MKELETVSQPINYPAPYEYSLMSLLAYQDKGKGTHPDLVNAGWERIQTRLLNNTSYYGTAFVNTRLKHVVIAHRGTLFNLDHVIDDLKLVWQGALPNSHTDAKAFSGLIRKAYAGHNYVFTETGHSLGGMLAILNGHTFNCRVVSFDSPGMGHILRNTKIRGALRFDSLDEENYVNYVSSPNSINVLGDPMGIWIRIFPWHSDEQGSSSSRTFEQTAEFFNLFKSFHSLESSRTKTKDFLALFALNFNLLYKLLLAQDIRLHSIANLVEVFDPTLGEPHLQCKVLSWPNSTDYWSWWWMWYSKFITTKGPKNLFTDRTNWNIECENMLRDLKEFITGDFIFHKFICVKEDLTSDSEAKLIHFRNVAVDHFGKFFGEKAKDKFSKKLPSDKNFVTTFRASSRSLEDPVLIGLEDKMERKAVAINVPEASWEKFLKSSLGIVKFEGELELELTGEALIPKSSTNLRRFLDSLVLLPYRDDWYTVRLKPSEELEMWFNVWKGLEEALNNRSWLLQWISKIPFDRTRITHRTDKSYIVPPFLNVPMYLTFHEITRLIIDAKTMYFLCRANLERNIKRVDSNWSKRESKDRDIWLKHKRLKEAELKQEVPMEWKDVKDTLKSLERNAAVKANPLQSRSCFWNNRCTRRILQRFQGADQSGDRPHDVVPTLKKE